MRILIGHEFSGIVRDEFMKRGHYALSCDLLPTEKPGNHYKGDIMDIINDGWDMMICFPDCTYLCSSGLHWNKRVPGREDKTTQAVEHIKKLLDAPIEKIALENPVGRIGTAIRKADQYIQPYQFGHDASKKTGLWTKNLSLLYATKCIKPRLVKGKPRWGNQTDSGQNKLCPHKDRWKFRSRTLIGVGKAFAEQWG